MQSLASIISQHLLSVSQHLSAHQDLFASTVVYPLPNFPGRAEESLLGQLLRKKLEPNVETWVEQGRKIANGIVASADGHASGEDIAALRELWNWAGAAANEEARKREWGDDFTLEERGMGTANVVTGLKRRLDDDEDEDESDEEGNSHETTGAKDAMEVDSGVKKTTGKEGSVPGQVPAPLPMNELLRFMSTGVEPRKVEAGRAIGPGLRR